MTIFSSEKPASAQAGPVDRELIAIGGGYQDVTDGWIATAIENANRGIVSILVLPVATATDPLTISGTERESAIQTADGRRLQIEEACKRIAPIWMICRVSLAPILTRSDALTINIDQFFLEELSALFFLGGDARIAVQVLSGTPLEEALIDASSKGVVFAGTGGGAGLLSLAMLAGYNPNFENSNALNFNAPQIWNSAQTHGLLVGIRAAILDTNFYQLGRAGRLLNAIAMPKVPHIGIGVDAFTGVHIPNGDRLERVFGRYTVTIFDAETYHASDGVKYRGCLNGKVAVLPCTPLLSLRNVLVHMLAPGNFSYDLQTREHSLGAPQTHSERTFAALRLPLGAGSLLLSGEINPVIQENPILARFKEISGGEQAVVLIYADGYPSPSSAQRVAQSFASAISADAQMIISNPEDPRLPELPLESEYNSIVYIAQDQSLVRLDSVQWLRNAWLSGKPVLAINAAAAVLGAVYSSHGPTPDQPESREAAVQRSLLLGGTRIHPGLGLLNLTIEPELLDDNRWGRFISLAYNDPSLVSIGLNKNSAIEISANGASALGENVALVLDLRNAILDIGENGGFVFANGLLDVYAAGESIEPEVADIALAQSIASTPQLFTPTPTPSPTGTATPTPTATPAPTRTPRSTRTPRPTATLPAIPPLTDPGTSNLMVASGVLIVIVVLVGLLLNRYRGY